MKLFGELHPKLKKHPWIFRIETLDRFYELLDHKQLTFVRPRLWSDPLENIIFNATLLRNGKPYLHPANEKIYAQCWSYDPDSYALWQIYTTKNENGRVKSKPGIRITTEIALLDEISKSNKGDFWFGHMHYLSMTELKKLKKDAGFIRGLQSETISEEHVRTLLVKRRSYAYESEVRLIANPAARHVDAENDNLCRLNIDPEVFITSLQFDPRMSAKETERHKDRLTGDYGFRPTQIKQSSLAKGNTFRFVLG